MKSDRLGTRAERAGSYRKKLGTAIAVFAVIGCSLSARAEDVSAPPMTAHDMVAASDKVRNPGQPFRLRNSITEYVRGKVNDTLGLSIYAREDGASGQYDNLVRYVDPPRDAGKMVLLDGSKMWFYDPASKASVRISPQQRLIGEAANGDVVSVNLARDYKAELLGAESLQDADRKSRDCWHLQLVAADDDAVYSRIDYWLERGTYYPVKGKYYADSGRLLKSAYFHNYREELGGMRPTEVIILDGVDTSLVTTMNFSDYRTQEIPDAWFQRDFLPHLPAE
jgi:hypothetical protein